jgi:hypothetical protein
MKVEEPEPVQSIKPKQKTLTVLSQKLGQFSAFLDNKLSGVDI